VLGVASHDGSALVISCEVPAELRERDPRERVANFVVDARGALTALPRESGLQSYALAGQGVVFCGQSGLANARTGQPIAVRGARLPCVSLCSSDCGRFLAGFQQRGYEVEFVVLRAEWNADRSEVHLTERFRGEPEEVEQPVAFAPSQSDKPDAEPLLARVVHESRYGVRILRVDGSEVRLLRPAEQDSAFGGLAALRWTRPSGAFLIGECGGGVVAWNVATGACVADVQFYSERPRSPAEEERAAWWLTLRTLRMSWSGKVAVVIDRRSKQPRLVELEGSEDPARWRLGSVIELEAEAIELSPAGDCLLVAAVESEGVQRLFRVRL
jgi:hypothetical protein